MSNRRTFDDYKSAILEIYRMLSYGPFSGSIRERGNIYRDVMEILTDFGYVSNIGSRHHPSYTWSEGITFPSNEEIQELINAALDKNRKTHKKRNMEESKVDRKVTAIVKMLLQGKSLDRIYRDLNENPDRWGGRDGAKMTFDYIRKARQIWKRLGQPKDPAEVIAEYRKSNRRERQAAEPDVRHEDGVLSPDDPPAAESRLDNLLLMMAIGFETIASEIRRYIGVFPEGGEL